MSLTFNALDGEDLIPLNSTALRERTIMTYNGHLTASFLLSEDDSLLGAPEVTIEGIYIDSEVKDKVNSLVYQVISTELLKTKDIEQLRKDCAIALKRLISRHFDKNPLVTVHIHKI